MLTKFKINHLFKNSKNIGYIKGTAFKEFDTSSKFISKYNTEIKPHYGNQKCMSLSYKIADSIVQSQNQNFNVFVCEQDGKEFFLMTMGEGAKDDFNYFVIDFNDNTYYSTNIYSHLMFIGGIGIVRYLNPLDEVDTLFRQLRFDESIIDTDQQGPFYTVADGLYYKFAVPLKDVEFENECEIETFKEAAKYIKKDITGLVVNNYPKIHISASAKNLGITAKGIKFVEPAYIEMPKTPEEVLKELKNKSYEVFSAKEIAKMPALLRDGYQSAKESFEMNKDFLSPQEWMLISEIYEGDVRSINLNGPAGVGKTTIIRTIAGALGQPFVLVGGSENIEEAHLIGTREVVVEDGASKTIWVDGPITLAIRYGGFLLFDEVNAAEPGVLMKLNTILDGSKALILPTGEEVKVHPKFVYADAMNIGAAYVGTNQMNMSHMDRMDQIFKISPKSVEDEAKIIAANTGYENMENLQRACRIKAFILDQIEENGDAAEQICSPRRLITWIKKAKRTGEFIESSLNTVIAHLCIYDPSIAALSPEAITESGDNVACIVFDKIQKEFKDIKY